MIIFYKNFFCQFDFDVDETSTDWEKIEDSNLFIIKHFNFKEKNFQKIRKIVVNSFAKKKIIPFFFDEEDEKYVLRAPYLFLLLEPFFVCIDSTILRLYQIFDIYYSLGDFKTKLHLIKLEKIFLELLYLFCSPYFVELAFMILAKMFSNKFIEIVNQINFLGSALYSKEWSSKIFVMLHYTEFRAICLDFFLSKVNPNYKRKQKKLEKINVLIELILKNEDNEQMKTKYYKNIFNKIKVLEKTKQKMIEDILSAFEEEKKKMLNEEKIKKDFQSGGFAIPLTYYVFDNDSIPTHEIIEKIKEKCFQTGNGFLFIKPWVDNFIMNNEIGNKSFEDYDIFVFEEKVFFLEKENNELGKYKTTIYVAEKYDYQKLKIKNCDEFIKQKKLETEEIMESFFIYCCFGSKIQIPDLYLKTPKEQKTDSFGSVSECYFAKNFKIKIQKCEFDFLEAKEKKQGLVKFMFDTFLERKTKK